MLPFLFQNTACVNTTSLRGLPRHSLNSVEWADSNARVQVLWPISRLQERTAEDPGLQMSSEVIVSLQTHVAI